MKYQILFLLLIAPTITLGGPLHLTPAHLSTLVPTITLAEIQQFNANLATIELENDPDTQNLPNKTPIRRALITYGPIK